MEIITEIGRILVTLILLALIYYAGYSTGLRDGLNKKEKKGGLDD